MTDVHIDKALVNRMLRGDQRAFDEFFDANFPRLYRFTRARIGDDEDATKEIVQQTLCRAIARIETYRGEAALFTWLCRICRNQISDHFKQRNRDMSRFAAFEDAEVSAVLESLDSGDDTDPSRLEQRRQVAQLIQTILDYLPARQGNVLEWKYVEGLTVEEIAARMDVTRTSVQSLLARARQSFRDGFRTLANVDVDQLLN